jgi:glycosyltransferase involved in cell wall biosynthesis
MAPCSAANPTTDKLAGEPVRVVHVPFGYFPDAVGGTEVYVAQLARDLRTHGVDSVIAAPADAPTSRRYEHEGIPVYRVGVAAPSSVADLYGEGDEAAARSIAAILDEVDADVLHLHAFTRAASVRAVRAAKHAGVAVVFTYHTPTASCVRGTLLRDGHEPCNGALIAQRCAACLLESRGVPAAIREALSRGPSALGSTLESIGASGAWVTALRARELTAARHDAFRTLLAESDAVVAVCQWVRALLLQAGASPERVVLSRQGTPSRAVRDVGGSRRRARPIDSDLRLAYAGRLHPNKGVDVVIRALSADRNLRATLDVYGVAQHADGARYRDELLTSCASDARVRFHAPLAAESVVEMLASYDATVVPSQWLETGPLIVLESFAAGTPVIGSNLGGIAELVSHDQDGWLVPHADTSAWTNALRRLATEPRVLDRLRMGVRPPRSTGDVARDMIGVYRAIVARRPTGPASTAGVA